MELNSEDLLVSIIIPVYNSSEFLAECIESVLAQTYKNIQIILIDDGSKDNSGEICRKYTETDPRIKFLSQENQGVSTARNRGLDAAEGAYIVFADSDDTLTPDSIKNRVEAIDECDLAVASFASIDENNTVIDEHITDPESITSDRFREILFDSSIIGYQGYLWNKIFRSDIINRSDLRFNKDISYNEDRLFVYEYILNSKIIKCISYRSYNYRIYSGSVMGQIKKKTFSPKMLSEIEAYDIMYDKAVRLELKESALIAYEAFYSCMNLYLILSDNNKKEKDFLSEHMKKYYSTVMNSHCGRFGKISKIKLFVKNNFKWFYKLWISKKIRD